MTNLKELAKEILEWLSDYEETTGKSYGDDETLEGSAHILFNKVLASGNSNNSLFFVEACYLIEPWYCACQATV